MGGDGGLAGLGAGGDDLLQADAFAVQLDLAEADATHIEQVVDEAHEMRELTIHHVDRAMQRRVGFRRQARDLQAVADRRERIAQLVGQRREELVFAPIRVVELALHRLAVADVDQARRHADGVASEVADRTAGQQDRQLVPVLVTTHGFQSDDLAREQSTSGVALAIVEHDFDDAEALVDRVDQRAVALLYGAPSGACGELIDGQAVVHRRRN
jgi:hypothetical protein